MTTKAAEQQYLADHQRKYGGQPPKVYNPKSRPVDELPVIYGFNNGSVGRWGDVIGIAINEDGDILAQHACSNEGYMPHDLGCVEGSTWQQDRYMERYPDGYRVEFVPYRLVDGHEKLQAAIAKRKAKEEADQ